MAKAGRHAGRAIPGRKGARIGAAVRMLAAFGLVFLSFAHQPLQARATQSPVDASLVLPDGLILPDGTVADICFGSDGVHGTASHGKDHGTASPVCDACRLSASILPSPPHDAFLSLAAGLAASLDMSFSPVLVAYPHALPPARAPPAHL